MLAGSIGVQELQPGGKPLNGAELVRLRSEGFGIDDPDRWELVRPTEVVVTVALDANFTATVLVVPQDDSVPVIARVEVGVRPPDVRCDLHRKANGSTVLQVPKLPRGGLPVATYRELPTTQILDAAKVALRGLTDAERAELGFGPEDRLDRPRRRGPRGRDELQLARIVEMKLQRVQSGSRTPNTDVAAVLGVKPSQIRDATTRARKLGLLVGTRPGYPDGALSTRAEALLLRSRQHQHDGAPSPVGC